MKKMAERVNKSSTWRGMALLMTALCVSVLSQMMEYIVVTSINCLKGKTLGGLAAPQTPSLLNVKIKSKNRTLGFAQTQQGCDTTAPPIVWAILNWNHYIIAIGMGFFGLIGVMTSDEIS